MTYGTANSIVAEGYHRSRGRWSQRRPQTGGLIVRRRRNATTMKVLVTGSAGHLGEAVVRTLQKTNHEIVSLDRTPSAFTSNVGSIADRRCARQCMRGVDAVLHAAALHKPHLLTHNRQDFIDTNITGTLNVLEEAASAGVAAFVF